MDRRTIAALVWPLVLFAAACGSARPLGGSDNDCGLCHGAPPALVASGEAHPQPSSGAWGATDCALCHPTSVDPVTGSLLAAASGGTHADGAADGAWHGRPYPSSVHGQAANAGLGGCTPCHGVTLEGGTVAGGCDRCHTGGAAWRTDCTFCHGDANPAPPYDLGGWSDPAEVTVGAHQEHVGATLSAPLGCSACHAEVDPVDVFSPGHLDPSPAEVLFGGANSVARTGGRAPVWTRTDATCANTWCHAQGGSRQTPTWTDLTPVGCGSCHPAAPSTGKHTLHSSVRTCADCHTGFTATTVDPSLHVNGVKDVPRLTTGACHPFGSGDTYGASCDGRSDW